MDQPVLKDYEINMVLRFRQLAREGFTDVVYDLQEQEITECVRRRTERMRPKPKGAAASAGVLTPPSPLTQ